MKQEVPSQPIPRWTQTTGGRVFLVIGSLLLVATGAFSFFVLDAYRRVTRTHVDLSQFSVSSSLTLANTTPKPPVDAPRATIETTDDPSLGPPDAPVTIVEFADFECPFSQRSFFVLKDLLAAYPDQVRIIFRDFPNTSIHPNAQAAAIAAACADDQGKFWQYHDLLYINQDRLSVSDLETYAVQVGLNLVAYRACVVSDRFSSEIDQDYADGLQYSVRGTPTWFINGHRLEGAIPLDIFQQIMAYGLAGRL